MKKQIKWDKYEVALLIESTLRIKQRESSRAEELQKLSDILRKKAENIGLDIDDIFRNYNGMSLQVAAIEELLSFGSSDRHNSRLFEEMVALYKSDLVKYEEILAEAHRQSE